MMSTGTAVMGLNYHHLYLFWVTARATSLTAASRKLSLAPSTVSEQIRALETELGQELFHRRGRALHMTERGQTVLEYADEIFALGKELLDASARGNLERHVFRLRVGVATNLPTSLVYEVLAPALSVPEFPVHLVCKQDSVPRLVAELEMQQLDLVLSDAPIAQTHGVAAESVLLGSTGLTLCATGLLAERVREGFPESCHGVPFVLPGLEQPQRALIEGWFARTGVRPHVVAEVDDGAMLNSLAQGGVGLMAVATRAAERVCNQYGLVSVGELEGCEERLYGLVLAPLMSNAAIQAILASCGLG